MQKLFSENITMKWYGIEHDADEMLKNLVTAMLDILLMEPNLTLSFMFP